MDEFVSLADLLRPPAPVPVPDVPCPVEPATTPSVVEAQQGVTNELDDVALRTALRDARLFRARLADAFDEARARLVCELAADVLARELRLASCDLDALARRVLAGAPVVRVRVAPSDVDAIRGVAVVADPELAAGDAVVELAGGALDARLGVRLALVLEAFA